MLNFLILLTMNLLTIMNLLTDYEFICAMIIKYHSKMLNINT